MDHSVILKTLLILMVVNLRMQQCAESGIFPPLHITLYNDTTHQRLFLEWDVGQEAYERELKMIFQIEVSRTEKMSIIWSGNYSAVLTKAHERLTWSWDSDLPLECVSHSVRIRSIVDDEGIPGTNGWSHWSPWLTNLGEDSHQSVFPIDKTVEEGSDVTFCCIAEKGQSIRHMIYKFSPYPHLYISNRSAVITVKEVALSGPHGSNVVCSLSNFANDETTGTVLFVGRAPDQPKNLSCETRDLKVLICSWVPGKTSNLHGNRGTTYRLSEWYSKNTANCSSNESCEWSINKDQRIYNITLTAENSLGKRYASIILDVAHRVHPSSPTYLWVNQLGATSTNLHWSMGLDYTALQLLCQVEVQISRNGETKMLNVTAAGRSAPALYTALIDGLQPYTNYSLRARCGAALHFWNWSEWSENVVFRTGEAAPTVGLDIWREINQAPDGRTLTLYWKPLSDFETNGELLSYNIRWESLDASSEPQNKSVSASLNHTKIFIGPGSYQITVTARNSVGSSPPSEMRITGVVQVGQVVIVLITDALEKATIVAKRTSGTKEKVIEEERVGGTGDGVNITWKHSPGVTDGYIVDWWNYPRPHNCDFQWKKYPPNVFSDVIKSDSFKPGIRYRFRVYGSYADGDRLLEKKTGYTKELAPVIQRSMNIKNHINAITLAWEQYSNDERQPGFISGYHVYIKIMHEECRLEGSESHALQDGTIVCKFTIRNPEKKTFTVEHLKPNTKYSLALTAFTDGGESPIDFSTAVDTLFDSDAVLLEFLLPVIIFSLVALLLLALGFWKRKWLKDALYPKIPDPYKSNAVQTSTIKGSSGRVVMILESCNPQPLEVMKGFDKGPCNDENSSSYINYDAMLTEENHNTAEMKTSSNPCYLSFEEQKHGSGSAQPCTDAGSCFENVSYMAQGDKDPNLIFMEGKTSEIDGTQSLPVLSYQPQTGQQPYSKLTDSHSAHPSPRCLSNTTKGAEYLAQSEVPFSEFSSNEVPQSPETEECLLYKAQTDFHLRLVDAVPFQDSMLSEEVSPTSTHSAVFLL